MHLAQLFSKFSPLFKTIVVFLIISLPLAGFYLGTTYIKSITPNNQNLTSENSHSAKSPASVPAVLPSPILEDSKISSEIDLVHYSNDVLGLEFNYPKEWGEIRSSPGDVITNLATVNKEFKDAGKGNDLKYMVTLSFSQNNYVTIKLIDNQYPGELFPNSYAFDFGPMDNWAEVRDNQDVCLYKVNYSQGIFHAQSLYSSCGNGINEVLIKSGQDDANYENYSLRRFGYKRLKNGYFDNFWLVASPAFTQSHDTSQNMTVEQVKSQVDMVKDKREFDGMVTLMASVKSFVPPKPTSPVFFEIAGENPDITLIRKYYYYLVSHQFEQAYQMSNNVSLVNIRDWYQNVIKADPRDFKTVGEGTYEFNVDYQDENTLPFRYQVDMMVTNGKLKTLKSEKYLTDVIYFDGISAVVKERQGFNYVVLTKNGKENIVDKAPVSYNQDMSNVGDGLRFVYLKFSSTGKYLTYRASGWEWSVVKIKDTQTLKPVRMEFSSARTVEFNSNDSKVLVCANDEMTGDSYATLYSLPNLAIERDFLKEAGTDLSKGFSLDCSFDKNSQIATIELKPWDGSIAPDTIKVDIR